MIADEMTDATSPADPVALTGPVMALAGRVAGRALVSRGPLSTAEQGEGLNLVEGLWVGEIEGDLAVDRVREAMLDWVANLVPAMDSTGVSEGLWEGETVGEGVEGRHATALGMYV